MTTWKLLLALQLACLANAGGLLAKNYSDPSSWLGLLLCAWCLADCFPIYVKHLGPEAGEEE